MSGTLKFDPPISVGEPAQFPRSLLFVPVLVAPDSISGAGAKRDEGRSSSFQEPITRHLHQAFLFRYYSYSPKKGICLDRLDLTLDDIIDNAGGSRWKLALLIGLGLCVYVRAALIAVSSF